MAGSKSFHLTVCKEKEGVRSLQELCRVGIIRAVTLKNIQQVVTLPLPTVLKEFLCKFCIPEDFDLEGVFLDYNFNFPNHVHHKSHQIHPAKCLLDGSKVLIKSEHSLIPCKLCNSVGNRTMRDSKTREIWLRVKHNNLMNCHLRMEEPGSSLTCFVFDYPLISLEDFVLKAFLTRKRIPEYLIWKLLKDLISVLQHLEKFGGLYPWELCQPQHLTIDEDGNIKLENMLLYLPVKSGSHFQTDTSNLSLYTSPEKLAGHTVGAHTVVWGLGCILRELTSEMPSVLLHSEHATYFAPLMLTNNGFYSKTLKSVVANCLNLNYRTRPTLKQLQTTTDHQLATLQGDYRGPDTLLGLISEDLGVVVTRNMTVY